MSSLDSDQFEDDALKAAIKRAAGSESAPPTLRHNVQMAMLAAMATSPADRAPNAAGSNTKSPGDSILTRPLSGWAVTGIAAALLLVVSGWVYFANRPNPNRYAYPAPAVPAAMTDELARSLIKSHDETVARTDLHRTSTADFARIRADLIKQLDQPVWVSDFRKDGWEFKGAAITNIGDVKAAHLLYTKGDASLSMMSMPVASSCGVSVEPMYQNTVDGHQVVTFTTGGEMFALVGYSPTSSLTLANVTALRDKYKNDITASVSRGHSAVAMAR